MGTQELTAIDAFCGAGGLGLGLQQAGFTIKASFDLNKQALETARANFDHPVLELDATELSGSTLLHHAGLDSLDVLAGGPPCQGFSQQNKGRSASDPRNMLVFHFARLVLDIRPKAFVMENVRAMSQRQNEKIQAALLDWLHSYNIEAFVLNSADYGVAQMRKRAFLVGVRKDLELEYTPPAPLDRQKTLHEALAGLPKAGTGDVPNHERPRVTPKMAARMAHIPPGGGWRDLPRDLMMPCHRRHLDAGGDPNTGWSDVCGRLTWNRPAPTLTTGFQDMTKGRFVHPDEDRVLTLREGARIQGFPDDFVFKGSRGAIARQIGNAVPPPLAMHMGRPLRHLLG